MERSGQPDSTERAQTSNQDIDVNETEEKQSNFVLPRLSANQESVSRDIPPVEVGSKPQNIAEQVARRVQTYEQKHQEPAAVLREMLTAAELDAPVERIYERRQEVRDEPGQGQMANGAMSVGSILQQTAPVLNPVEYKSPPLGDSASVQTTVILYKRAIFRGFYLGLAILMLGLLAYVIF